MLKLVFFQKLPTAFLHQSVIQRITNFKLLELFSLALLGSQWRFGWLKMPKSQNHMVFPEVSNNLSPKL